MSDNSTVADLGPQLNITGWLLTGTAGLFLLLRVYCKLLQRRTLWWDDHLLIISWIGLTVASALTTASIAYGFGKHRTDLDRDSITWMTKLNNISSVFSITASAWSKTSFALTLLRIYQGQNRRTGIALWVIIITINITKAVSATVTWVSCTPFQKAWMPFEEGTCWPRQIPAYYNLFSGAYSGVMDLVLAFLPWPLILTLSMRRGEKIGVGVAMSMGIGAAVTAFVKCSKIPTLFGGDFSYEGVPLVAWGSAETAATIMAASIPMLRVLVRGTQPLTPEIRFGSRAACELSLSAAARDRARKDTEKVLAPGLFKSSGEVIIQVEDFSHRSASGFGYESSQTGTVDERGQKVKNAKPISDV